jgi:hypothetical protein
MIKRRKALGTHPTSFLSKTFEILSEESLKDIISWNEDGTSFIIKNVTDFSETVLPKYFKHSNFASFVRQLNMYDFHKCKNGEENSFCHSLFQKGRRHLLKDIHRKTSQCYNPQISRSLSRAETKALFERIKNMKSRQESLEANANRLESMYSELSMKNQILISQIQIHREREKRNENVIMMLTGYVKNNCKGDFHIPKLETARTQLTSFITGDYSPHLPPLQMKRGRYYADASADSPANMLFNAYEDFPLDDASIDILLNRMS